MGNNSELESLQNAANNLNLKIYEKFTQDKRATIKKYFATQNGMCVSPVLEYTHLNYFLLGWSRCEKLMNAPVS